MLRTSRINQQGLSTYINRLRTTTEKTEMLPQDRTLLQTYLEAYNEHGAQGIIEDAVKNARLETNKSIS